MKDKPPFLWSKGARILIKDQNLIEMAEIHQILITLGLTDWLTSLIANTLEKYHLNVKFYNVATLRPPSYIDSTLRPLFIHPSPALHPPVDCPQIINPPYDNPSKKNR